MSSDIVCCEEVGNICFAYNRTTWMIPNFYDLEKNTRFKSPPFTVNGGTWQLRFCCFRSVLSRKEWLDIGVKLLSKTSEFKVQGARFGIAGKNLEISKTLQSVDDFSKYSQLTLPYEQEMYEWTPDENLCLFFKTEIPEVNRIVDSFFKARREIGNEDATETKRNVCVDVSTQTQNETGVCTFHRDLQDFLLNGTASDIVLKVNDQEFKSHRCILAAHSPVFSDMFTRETKEKDTEVLDIQCVDQHTFSIFHNYLYTGDVSKITSESVIKLYTVAKKYKVQELEKKCMDYILKNIHVGSFCDVLKFSIVHEDKDLQDACSLFFMENSLDIVTTPEWELFLSENPEAGNKLYVKLLKMNKKEKLLTE